jgi:hypothetical protein
MGILGLSLMHMWCLQLSNWTACSTAYLVDPLNESSKFWLYLILDLVGFITLTRSDTVNNRCEIRSRGKQDSRPYHSSVRPWGLLQCIVYSPSSVRLPRYSTRLATHPTPLKWLRFLQVHPCIVWSAATRTFVRKYESKTKMAEAQQSHVT